MATAQKLPAMDEILREKRISTIASRIGSTLHDIAEREANDLGMSLSDYIIYALANQVSFQAEVRKTLCDGLAEMDRAVDQLATTVSLQKLILAGISRKRELPWANTK